MCLNEITRKIENVTKKEHWAWKVFRIEFDKLFFMFRLGGVRVRRGTWLKAKEEILYATTPSVLCPEYASGFHCFLKKENAERLSQDFISRYVAVRVKVRYIHTLGTEYINGNSSSILVAREMYVPLSREE